MKRLKLFVVTLRGTNYIIAAEHSTKARTIAMVVTASSEPEKSYSTSLLGSAKQGTTPGVLYIA